MTIPMAQLDRLLAVLVSRRGDSIRLVQDEPAFLLRGEESQALTRGPLTPAQMLTIVREVAPADTEQRAERGEGAQFEYTMGSDAFVGRLHRDRGRLTLHVTPRAPANGATPITPTPLAVAAVASRDDHEARAVIDDLLRNQTSRNASDLHLRSGERPLFRVDGEIVSETGRDPLDGAFLERMLLAIMPERNRREFEEHNDTDPRTNWPASRDSA